MSRGVATAVAVELSQKKLDADTNTSGSWSILVGPITEPSSKINTEKGAALLSADVLLIYLGGTIKGTSPPASIPPVISSIKLTQPENTKLIHNQKCLLENDKKEDDHENCLKVSDVSAKLKVGG